MNYATSAVPISKPRTLADRVREIARGLGCSGIWVRAMGPHVLVGLGAAEAFARLTPLGIGAYGLSFRSPESNAAHSDSLAPPSSGWEPVLLIDGLAETVEHALVGEGAISAGD